MESIDVSVHPLFFLFGIYYSLTGRFLIFTVYTLTALIHESGHSFVASRRGYFLKRITLMPFGAIVSGDSDFRSEKDEIAVALAGPLTNLFIGLFFVALWWIFPTVYPFTDIIVEANLSLAIVNFLPFFPLDGGRILYSLLSVRWEKESAGKICKVISLIGVTVLFAFFIISVFNKINLSLLFFSLFLLFSAFDKKGENKYVKICTQMTKKKLLRGIGYNKIAVDGEITLKKLFSLLDGTKLNEVVVFHDGKEVAFLSPEKIEKLLTEEQINLKLDDFLKNS